MSYVIAGYSIVLAILFLYAVLLVVRRRRLTAAAVRVAATGVASSDGVPVGPTAATGSTPGGGAGAGGDGR